jgi:hypothetical protein
MRKNYGRQYSTSGTVCTSVPQYLRYVFLSTSGMYLSTSGMYLSTSGMYSSVPQVCIPQYLRYVLAQKAHCTVVYLVLRAVLPSIRRNQW